MVSQSGLPVQRACQAAGLSRATYYRPVVNWAQRDGVGIEALTTLGATNPRWGFWKYVDRLRNTGHRWNHKRVHRVYCTLRLNLPRRTRRRVPTRLRQPLVAPACLNETWALDFMADALYDGRSFRTFNVLDEGNREALAIEIGTSIPSARVIRILDDCVRLVGAFCYTNASDDSAHYRSIVLARTPERLDARRGSVAAVNGWNSLSGWASLAWAVSDGQTPFFRDVVVTGTHLASVDAVRDGRVDVASIDEVTVALLHRHRPQVLRGLHTIARGPRVPCLPLVTALAGDVAELRRAIGAALADRATRGARHALLIESFVPLELDAYEPVRTLVAALR
jgi:putative transposase